MAGDVKNQKMGFHRCIGEKIRLKKAYANPHSPPPPPLKNKPGGLVASNMEEAVVLGESFSSVFTGTVTKPLETLNLKAGTWGTKSLPS